MPNPLILEIGGVDYSQYLRRIDATPSGPGQVGQATLYLTKEAGGLSILPTQTVKLWRTFNAGGAGVQERGRIFGGFVVSRQEENVGTTKMWTLDCVTFNVGIKSVVRDAAPSFAFTVTAGTFAEQVLQIVNTVQRNGTVVPNEGFRRGGSGSEGFRRGGRKWAAPDAAAEGFRRGAQIIQIVLDGRVLAEVMSPHIEQRRAARNWSV